MLNNLFSYIIPFGPSGYYVFGPSHQYITRLANFSLNFLYLEAKFDYDYFIPVYFLGSSQCAHNISAHFENNKRHCDFRGRTGKKYPVLQMICKCVVMYAYVK